MLQHLNELANHLNLEFVYDKISIKLKVLPVVMYFQSENSYNRLSNNQIGGVITIHGNPYGFRPMHSSDNGAVLWEFETWFGKEYKTYLNSIQQQSLGLSSRGYLGQAQGLQGLNSGAAMSHQMVQQQQAAVQMVQQQQAAVQMAQHQINQHLSLRSYNTHSTPYMPPRLAPMVSQDLSYPGYFDEFDKPETSFFGSIKTYLKTLWYGHDD